MIRESKDYDTIPACGLIHDFGDGRGPVPSHRHHDRSGWVEDGCYVSDTAYISPTAEVSGCSCIESGARVGMYARVSGSTIQQGVHVGDWARVSGVKLTSKSGSYRGTITRHPIEIRGIGEYTVVITDDLVCVGCTAESLHWWRTRGNMAAAPGVAQYADLIAAIAERHQAAVASSIDPHERQVGIVVEIGFDAPDLADLEEWYYEDDYEDEYEDD